MTLNARLKALNKRIKALQAEAREAAQDVARRTTPTSKKRALKKWAEVFKRLAAARADRVKLLRRIKEAQKPKRMSPKGREMLVREEGVRRWAYKDPVGWVTFGVGHLVTPAHKTITRQDEDLWGTPARPKPMSLVMSVLADDLKKYEAAVLEATQGKLTRASQFDACVSLCFNIGVAGFKGSTAARLIREGKLNEAADAFLNWSNPSILRPRRERERKLFLTGIYS